MDERLARAVRRRAGSACEYCRLPAGVHPTPFEIEHVIPRQHGGNTVLSNLAYACLHCNRHKGPNVSGVERRAARRVMVALFNPRRHKWHRHFRWVGPKLVGRSAIGRVTIAVLAMNDPLRVAVRAALMDEGRFHPPA
jgi:HNH endonuclease